MHRRLGMLCALFISAALPAGVQAQSCDYGPPYRTPWFHRLWSPSYPPAPSWTVPAPPMSPAAPVQPSPEVKPAPETKPSPETKPTPEAAPAPTPAPDFSAFGSEAGAATGGSTAAFASANLQAPGGYLDSAIPRNTFRLRYDSMSDFNRFDRAAYFYAPWQELSFHTHPLVNQSGQLIGVQPATSRANGFEQLPGRLDQQQIGVYLEYALNKRFSVFGNLPIRFVHTSQPLEEGQDSNIGAVPPTPQNPLGRKFFQEPGSGNPDVATQNNTGGVGDLDFGFKAAIIADPTRYLTVQFRTYVPTGVTSVGMGTGHVSLEPSLLYYQQLGERFYFQAQFGDWIPLGNTPLAGNVIDYGAGLSFDAVRRDTFKITPVTEVLGWTVLSGGESVFQPIPVPASLLTALPDTHGVRQAAGDTIVNLKLGVRVYWGQGNSLYLGWGHALTGDRWYRDDARVEYRFLF